MINLLNGLKEKYPSVTYADMYQLASALAIEVRSSGLACLASHIWNSLRSSKATLPPNQPGCSSLLPVLLVDCSSVGLPPAAVRSAGGSVRHVSQGVWR